MQKNNTHFAFKKLTQDNLSTILPWFKEKHVAQWWPTPETNELLEHFFKRIKSKNTFGYIVYANNTPIGYIQYYHIDRTNEKDSSWLPPLPIHTIGTDQFIGDPNYINKGYGTQFIKQFIDYLHTIEPNATTVIVDPDPENAAAIRCYEKVEFKKAGVFNVTHGAHLLMRYDY